MSLQTIHVFTDVGVKDIDDELLIMYLCSQKNLDLTFVFMGSDNVSPSAALAHWIREYEPTVLSTIPCSQVSVKSHSFFPANVSYMTISEYKEFDAIACDYALQIAPMSGYEGYNLTVREKYVFAGDYATPIGCPDSFNKEGSQDILDRFKSQDKLIEISSSHMAKMRFNNTLFSKFTGNFRENIVFTAFMLAFGRMDPTHPANKFAEGLINPNVGRGANYSSVMKMGFALQGVNIDALRGMEQTLSEMSLLNIKSCEIAATNYCDTLEANGVTLKDREGTIKCLTDMNIYLQSINNQSEYLSEDKRVDIFESGSVFTSSEININGMPHEILPAWDFFKSNAESITDAFNPVYDLFAGYVLMGIIKGDGRVNHTPEEFLKNIVYEF
jgi:hypothetical protein